MDDLVYIDHGMASLIVFNMCRFDVRIDHSPLADPVLALRRDHARGCLP